jgi:hypothetical protein
MGKETFLPFMCVLSVLWCLADPGCRHQIARIGAWIALAAIAGVLTTAVVDLVVENRVVWPWDIAASERLGSFFPSLFKELVHRNVVYTFIWLAPLGAFRIRNLPRPWVVGSLGAALAATVLGAWHDMGGGVARPLFSCLGGVLSCSTAVFLWSTISGSPHGFERGRSRFDTGQVLEHQASGLHPDHRQPGRR